jgi:hypothetical protein
MQLYLLKFFSRSVYQSKKVVWDGEAIMDWLLIPIWPFYRVLFMFNFKLLCVFLLFPWHKFFTMSLADMSLVLNYWLFKVFFFLIITTAMRGYIYCTSTWSEVFAVVLKFASSFLVSCILYISNAIQIPICLQVFWPFLLTIRAI